MPFTFRRRSPSFFIALAGCLLFSGGFACSESTDDPLGSTGGVSSGGTASGGTGTGGVVATGGALATGGISSGGSTGTGGAATGGSSSGGTQSTGGADATGGSASGGSGAGSGGTGSGGEVGSGGEQGSGGAQGVWSPCPETGACKILPLGDSITFGLAGSGGGYRVELFRLATEAGHEITFTGTQTPNGPDMVAGVAFPKNHAGISGQTISQIAGRIPNPDMQDVPHIVLVHAGTNDMNGMPGGATDRLGDLMDKLIEEAPDALIVVSTIIPLPFAASAVASFNAEIEPMVEARASQGAHILFVDQFEGFPEGELGDGVHPNDTGYARMGAKWYQAIESYLP